ncbi:MAG: HEXXH motif-containing putative peptide modification protein [Aquisalimonadaceae bacterium]
MIYHTGLDEQIKNVMAAIVHTNKKGVGNLSSLDMLECGYHQFIEDRETRYVRKDTDSPNFISTFKDATKFCQTLQMDAISLLDDRAQTSVIDVVEDAKSELKKEKLISAYSCLKHLCPEHGMLFDLIITDVFIMPSDRARGGSTSSALGVIWANPNVSFRPPDVIEFLVHELTHHAMFLDEIAWGHYDYTQIVKPESWAVSAVLNTSRPVDKVLHSLVVAAEILMLREQALGHPATPRAHPPSDLLIKQARNSITSINEVIDRCSDNAPMLLPRAKELLEIIDNMIDAISQTIRD